MTQRTRTTNELILAAAYRIGELPVGYPLPGDMMRDGLDILNEIIDAWAADSIYIPYNTVLSFNTVANQGTYTVSDMIVGQDVSANRIIDLVYCNYFVESENETVQWNVEIIPQSQVKLNVILTTLATRPSYVYLDNQPQVSNVVFYPVPDQVYPIKLTAKLMLSSLEQNQNLNNLPPYYYRALKLALAREFVSLYPSGNWDAKDESTYQNMMKKMKSGNTKDIAIRNSQILRYSYTPRRRLPNLSVI